MPSNHLVPCRPLLLLPSIFPSIRVFSNESALRMRWPKYCSFSRSISPYNEHSGLVSFRMDWLDLLAVQGTLQSLLQHHSSKASILQRSAFFMVRLSHTPSCIRPLTHAHSHLLAFPQSLCQGLTKKARVLLSREVTEPSVAPSSWTPPCSPAVSLCCVLLDPIASVSIAL